MKSLLAVIAALACGAASAQSISYRGLPLGSTKAELLQRFPDLECKPSPVSAHTLGEEMCDAAHIYVPKERSAPLFSYGGAPVAEPRFIIINGRVEAFIAEFLPKNYDAIRNALEQAHGPGKEQAVPIQTMMGASTTSRRWMKTMPGGQFTLAEHAGTIEYGAVQISSDQYQAFSAAKRSGNAKAGASDL